MGVDVVVESVDVETIDKKLAYLEKQVEELRRIIVLSRLKAASIKPDEKV